MIELIKEACMKKIKCEYCGESLLKIVNYSDYDESEHEKEIEEKIYKVADDLGINLDTLEEITDSMIYDTFVPKVVKGYYFVCTPCNNDLNFQVMEDLNMDWDEYY